MAKAQIVHEDVTRRMRMRRIQLTLTEGEADFLTTLMALVSGDHSKSPRKYANRIARALHEATGLNFLETDAYKLIGNYLHGWQAVHFDNYPDTKAPRHGFDG